MRIIPAQSGCPPKGSPKKRGVSAFASKAKRSRQAQFRAVLDAVQTADTRCLVDAEMVRLDFLGARLASLNQLLGRDGRELNKHAQAWHASVRRALCGHRPLPCFERAHIRVIRTGPRAVDPDNIIAKALIDALRHEKILRNDTPDHVASYTTEQRRGDYRVELEVRIAKS